MTLPLIFDEMLPKLLHKAFCQILQIVASIVTDSAQHCAMLEAIAKFDDVGICLYMLCSIN